MFLKRYLGLVELGFRNIKISLLQFGGSTLSDLADPGPVPGHWAEHGGLRSGHLQEPRHSKQVLQVKIWTVRWIFVKVESMDCIIHKTGCFKIVIRTVVREGNLIPTRQYLLISYNSYISKFYFSCLFHALLLFFFSQNITSKLVKAFL